MTEEKIAYLIPVRNVKKSKGTICSFLIFCSEEGREAIDEFLSSQHARVDFIYNSAKGIVILVESALLLGAIWGCGMHPLQATQPIGLMVVIRA